MSFSSDVVCLFLFLFTAGYSAEEVTTIDLLNVGTYTWEGLGSRDFDLNVTAANFSIAVTIETCDIGNREARPNLEYLVIRQGSPDKTASEDGRTFAYIKKPKKLYFFSSSVVLELKAPKPLNSSCKVIFEKADAEDTTLPPVTTTPVVPTDVPNADRYATVYISGKSIYDLNHDNSLVPMLKEDIAEMAENYTSLEGFNLTYPITSQSVKIDALEQCPSEWPNFENCIRLVYSIPVQIDEEYSNWKGYQINRGHLDIMWSRMANQYLKNGFSVYHETSVNGVVTWWMISISFCIILFAAGMITVNLMWKRKVVLKRARSLQNEEYVPDVRQTSDLSLTPPYFQSIPPMFDKTNKISTGPPLEDKRIGADNKGFEYNEIPDSEDEAGA